MRNSQSKKAFEIISDQPTKLAINSNSFFGFFWNLDLDIWNASKKGDLDIVRILHREGQDINQQSVFLKNSALHIVKL